MDLLPLLKLCRAALEHSEPKAKHYAEPVERHARALAGVDDAIAELEGFLPLNQGMSAADLERVELDAIDQRVNR